jgi:hypothetical protein
MTETEGREAKPRAAASCLARLGVPWAFAGGWALDLWSGSVTREHLDVDIALYRADQAALRPALPGWTFEVVARGARRVWPEGEWLALPIHEVHAVSPVRIDPVLEFLLNEREGTDWVFRRNPAVRRPLSQAIVDTSLGFHVLAPEIVLLFKAQAPRPVDEQDFAAVLPRLGVERRAWLSRALALCHPDHPWSVVLK